jgi:DUF1365 family protein
VGYVFAFSEPRESISVGVTDRTEEGVFLATRLTLTASALSDRNLLQVVATLGPMSARALALIYWQALGLFAKRVPYFRHTPPPAEEVSL